MCALCVSKLWHGAQAEKEAELHTLAAALLEHETLSGGDIRSVLDGTFSRPPLLASPVAAGPDNPTAGPPAAPKNPAGPPAAGNGPTAGAKAGTEPLVEPGVDLEGDAVLEGPEGGAAAAEDVGLTVRAAQGGGPKRALVSVKGPEAKQRPGRHRPVQIDQQPGPAGQKEMRTMLAEGVRAAVSSARGGHLPDGSASHKGLQDEPHVALRKASSPLVSLWTRNST